MISQLQYLEDVLVFDAFIRRQLLKGRKIRDERGAEAVMRVFRQNRCPGIRLDYLLVLKQLPQQLYFARAENRFRLEILYSGVIGKKLRYVENLAIPERINDFVV